VASGSCRSGRSVVAHGAQTARCPQRRLARGAVARRLAKRAWDADPGFAPAALAYAARLREAGKENRALDVLRTSWMRSPHPDIADAMLSTATDDMTRARRAEALAAAAPNSVETQLLLGRVALAAGFPSDALRRAEEARAAGVNQRRLWLLLADIAERSGDSAAQADALRHAARADPDPAWRCGACGTVLPTWSPRCPRCDATGQVTWGEASAAPLRQLVADGGDTILP
jgi:HemY protein